MDDFLNWYLGPRTRVGRAMFNTIMILATLPLLFFQFYGFVGEGKSTLDMAESLLKNNRDPAQMTHAMNEILQNGATVATPVLSWIDVFGWATMILLAPIILMRLRDMGKTGQSGHILLGVLLAPVGLDMLTRLTNAMGLEGLIPEFFTGAMAVVSFCLFLWVCVAPTVERQFPQPPHTPPRP